MSCERGENVARLSRGHATSVVARVSAGQVEELEATREVAERLDLHVQVGLLDRSVLLQPVDLEGRFAGNHTAHDGGSLSLAKLGPEEKRVNGRPFCGGQKKFVRS